MHNHVHMHHYCPSLSNQSFYRQIAIYQSGVSDHRVVQLSEGVMGQQN